MPGGGFVNGRQWSILVAVLAALNLFLAAALYDAGIARREAPREAEGAPGYGTTRKYVLYVGLNDKDSGTQLVSLEQARERLNSVAASHVGGFTVFQGHGFWTGGDRLDREETLVYVFYDAAEAQITAVADAMLTEMNQSAILVERSDAVRMFRTSAQ